MDTWKVDVFEALTELNRESPLKDIYQQVKNIRTNRGQQAPASAEAIIRRTLEKYSSDTKTYSGKEDLFKSTYGVGKGVWELRKARESASDTPYNEVKISPQDLAKDLKTLRAEAYQSVARNKSDTTKLTRTIDYIDRCKKTKAYALGRANGHCECCGTPAPFYGKDGIAFLEVHHIHQLSKEGADAPSNVAAITPNCHRRIHLGIDGLEINARLAASILEKEALADDHSN